MKKYFAYIRVSTKGQDISLQRDPIERYAAQNGLSIVAWFEETRTAAKQGRTVFTRMLTDLERGVADGLIVHKIDRSARNLKDWANLAMLIDRGVDVRFAHDGVDLHSRGGRLSADVQAIVAADYVRNLREEVIKGLRGRLKSGIYPFAAPIGYLDTGKAALKVSDPIRAPLVRQAFELYATGAMGLKDLLKEMRRRGLRSQRSLRPLALTTLSTMLNNPFYIGIIHIRRTNTTYQGKHQPIITKALFDRVQAILRGKLFARAFKHDFLFRRMIRCTGCGYHLIGERHKTYYVYYRCHTPTCKGVSVREDAIDHAVQVNLQFLGWDMREQAEARELAAEMTRDRIAGVEEIRASLRLRLAQCENRIERLTDVYVDEAIDRDLFESRKRRLLHEKRGLLDQIANASELDLPNNRALEKLELGNAAYHGYKIGIRQEKRDMVEAVTSNLSVQGKNPIVTLKSPFSQIAEWRKSQQCAPLQTIPRQDVRELLDILVALDTKSRKDAEPKNASRRSLAA